MKSNRLKDLKHEYDNIEIPDRLDDVIMEAFNMNNKKDSKKTVVRWSIIAASICVIVGTVNLSPTFASTFENIPVLGNVIKIINFKNYRINKNGYDVSIDVPSVDGLKDKGLEYKLNNEFEAEGKQMYNEYLSEIKGEKENG